MRRIYPNEMVAHVWAQQSATKTEGRSSNGSFRFTGRRLYSYSTPIANFATGANGDAIPLFSSDGYSPTTAGKHLSPARRAVNYSGFSVPYLLLDYSATAGRSRTWIPLENQHRANIEHFIKLYHDGVARFERMRDNGYHFIDLRASILSPLQTALKYVDAFGLSRCLVTDAVSLEAAEADTRRIHARFERLAGRSLDPKVAKARQQRCAVKAHKDADRLAVWLGGASIVDSLPDHPRGPSFAYMRIKGEEVQTSRGARVPLRAAVALYRFAITVKQPWQGRVNIGDFTMTSISDGVVTIGCHRLHLDDMRELYDTLPQHA